MSKSFVQLTADDVKKGWELGDYTAAGYLYLLARTSSNKNWPLTAPNIARHSQELKISRDAFTKARAKLLAQGRIVQTSPGYYTLAS